VVSLRDRSVAEKGSERAVCVWFPSVSLWLRIDGWRLVFSVRRLR